MVPSNGKIRETAQKPFVWEASRLLSYSKSIRLSQLHFQENCTTTSVHDERQRHNRWRTWNAEGQKAKCCVRCATKAPRRVYKWKGVGSASGVVAVSLLSPFLGSQVPRPREDRPPHRPIHFFLSEEGRWDVAATQQQRLTFSFFVFFLHGRTEESLSPGATSPRLLDTLSFIQCEIAAINPALREAYHSGGFFFFFLVDTSCQTDTDSISLSIRPPERAATVSRITRENHTACDAQRPMSTSTRLQGQSAVPC